MLNKYRLKDGVPDGEYTIPGVGQVKNREIETAIKLESPILELVESSEINPSPAHMNGVASQSAQPGFVSEQSQADSTAESNQ